jgi:hypothetical protein
MSTWRFTSLQSGVEFELEMSLTWELNGDPMSDDYHPEEITAVELWNRWVERYGEPIMPILWFVQGPGKFEAAPRILQPQDPDRVQAPDFLTYYTPPVEVDDDEPVQWSRLPVEDKLWRVGRGDKGGFIQEATGWKPSPLQSHADITVLARAANLRLPTPPG